MEVVELARECLHALQILGHGLERELARTLLGRARVVRVRCMRHQAAETILLQDAPQSRDVIEVERLHAAATRVAREERERVRADGTGSLAHGGIALSG